MCQEKVMVIFPKLADFGPFEGVNLYGLPCVQIFRYIYEILTLNTMVCTLFNTIGATQFGSFKNQMTILPITLV